MKTSKAQPTNSTCAPLTRRRFLGASTLVVTAFSVVPRHVLGAGETPPSAKLNIAGIGVGGMGASNLEALKSQNIVALCDVDRWRLQLDSPAAARCAKRNRFALDSLKTCFRTTDFRQAIAHKGVDAVMLTVCFHRFE